MIRSFDQDADAGKSADGDTTCTSETRKHIDEDLYTVVSSAHIPCGCTWTKKIVVTSIVAGVVHDDECK